VDIDPAETAGGSPVPGTPALLRAINDRTALRLLADRGPLSRSQLGALANLSKPTASQLMDRLETAGLVEAVPAEAAAPRAGADQDPAAAAAPGRAARLYRLRADAAYVAGLDVNPARIVARVCDLSGRTAAEAVLPTPGRSAVGGVDRVREVLDLATAEAGLTPERLHHIVIGVPGALDPATGRLGYARHLPGWHSGDLLPRLRGGLTPAGRPDPGVDVENDVNLVAIAEQNEGAARGAHDFVVLWIAEGIGAAVVIDGRLHRGATGGAGEVGYMPVPGAPRVRSLGRGANGGFQALAGAPAVLRLAREHGLSAPDAVAALGRAVAALAEPAAPAAEPAARFLRVLADRLATGLAPIVAVLDPELIVLTGAILRAGGAPLRELIAEALHGLAIPRPRLAASLVPDNPVLAGAIQAALAVCREAVFRTTFPGTA
jgi:predicted NBD/HSP70 family sugar kinase